METKHSAVKVIISKLKWFGLALLVFMLEQAPHIFDNKRTANVADTSSCGHFSFD
ncbi:hypothetical protein [Streptococcus equi]|uniref:hypothetical protein n=1 Tax=Streptococcus equi TaxID=1336 RepID=UPI0039C5CADC